jgi:C4-dicarboxylate-specific signal transduction histidine kinase
MELFYSAAINLIFYTTILVLFLCLMFFFIGLSRRLFLNCLSMLLIVTPLFLRYNRFVDIITFSFTTMIGLCIYPITLSLMIKHHYNQYRQTPIIPVYVISAASFFSLMILPDYSILIIYMMHLFFYLYIIYIIFPGKHERTSVLLLTAIFFNFFYLSVTVYSLNEIHFILSAGLMSNIITLILGYRLKKRISGLMNQFGVINELNSRLNHRITRLKQSNDSCRKIILEKDLELSQMARHASLAELTAGIAHELAQPLTGIKGIAQNMIDDINAEEFENLQAVSELLRICALVDKSSTIINHIRNFSKKTIPAMKQIDLNYVILDAIDLINLQLKKNSIDLVFVLDDTIPKIIGDKISLEQLIVNIILNSKDAILEKEFQRDDEGGTIRITTFAADSAAMMIIQDNGSGISEDIKHKIWSPFFTTKKREHGTGIGLSICGKILKDHNATVDIQSDKNGTQFSIRFPA